MALCVAVALTSFTLTAADTFQDPDAPPAEFVSLEHVRDNLWELAVSSPSMQRNITNDLVLPEGGPDNTAPRPTFYLLGGVGGGGRAGSGSAPDFFRGKLINVVTPSGAIGSQQADWAQEDPTVGLYKWTTYVTKKLPPLIDAPFHGTGHDAIAGMSMSGGPALHIATLDEPVKDSPAPLLVVDEQFAYTCTRYFVDEAREAGLDVDFYEFDEGTHNWGLFRRQLPATWVTIGRLWTSSSERKGADAPKTCVRACVRGSD
ncbi:Putative esterase [Corynebacterium auris]|nr:Putative esterase [Corynebacterium auris]